MPVRQLRSCPIAWNQTTIPNPPGSGCVMVARFCCLDGGDQAVMRRWPLDGEMHWPDPAPMAAHGQPQSSRPLSAMPSARTARVFLQEAGSVVPDIWEWIPRMGHAWPSSDEDGVANRSMIAEEGRARSR